MKFEEMIQKLDEAAAGLMGLTIKGHDCVRFLKVSEKIANVRTELVRRKDIDRGSSSDNSES